jgi:hypothetical protein
MLGVARRAGADERQRITGMSRRRVRIGRFSYVATGINSVEK